MSTDKDVQIFIAATSGWVKFARVTLSGAVLLYAPIAVGIACDSSAMQWAGFLLGAFAFIGWAKIENGKTTFKSTGEARVYLDKIDAGTAP